MQRKKSSGVEGLIEIENPNRISQKSKKVTEVDVDAPRELSRRERWVLLARNIFLVDGKSFTKLKLKLPQRPYSLTNAIQV